MTKKWIREGRMGPPMSYKTGAVVETYPKPMLVLEFDTGGLDVIKQPIVTIHPKELAAMCKKEQAGLPPITAVDFSSLSNTPFSLEIKSYDNITALNFLDVVNCLVINGCPWKTVVLDHITGLVKAFVGHIGVTDSKAMDDARKWAHMAGVLSERAIMVVQGLQAHTVFLMHVETEKNEVTGEIITEPMMPSKFRMRLPGLFSQFFYATIEGGVAIVYAQPTGFIKGLGMRKPDQAAAKMKADFRSIYGTDYD